MTPRPFDALLKDLIGLLKARAIPGSAWDPPDADNPIPQRFDDGIAHLQRWLDYGEADKIWNEIAGAPPFNERDARDFVIFNLEARRAAEEADSANKKIPLVRRQLKRLAPKARKVAAKRLAENKITLEQFAERVGRAEQALQRPGLSDPVLSGRSDRDGARKRVIFCRILKGLVQDLTGQPHDRVVEALCHIALGGEVDARSARRPSTRKRHRR
jgi:hypothetical protein